MTFKQNRSSKSNLDLKLCQFLYFIYKVIIDKLQNCGKFPVYIGPSFQSVIMKIGTNGEYLFQNTKITTFL